MNRSTNKVARRSTVALAAVLIFAACGSDTTEPAATAQTSAPQGGEPTQGAAEIALRERMTTIDDAVTVWRESESFDVASVAAETAANLIVGPNGPSYGDRNGDGNIDGATDVGVLSGLDGSPAGLALALADNECIVRDVLGGSWEDPAAEWDKMTIAIDNWRPDNNTMPTLASHPMRIIGWATFTQDSGSLDKAHEYAGHAKLHVDVTLDAIDC